MTIYELTYLSDDLPVKAYLGVPSTVAARREDILAVLTERYGAESGVAVSVVEGDSPSSPSRGTEGAHVTLPGLVYCRGGIGRVGMAKLPWIRDFMTHEVVVMAPWYRGTFGGPGRDEFGGADCEDVSEAYRLLMSMPFVQADCIAALGFSRGSVNAARLAATVTDLRHLILWGGVSDLAWTYEERVDLRRMLKRVIGKSPMVLPEPYRERSPARFARDIHCPVLVVHGTQDEQVPYRHAQLMCASLKDAGMPFAAHIYEGYGHHPSPLVHQAVIHRMLEHVFRECR